MKREMKKYGLPEPEFYEERDSFKVIFRNTKTKLDQQVSGQVSAQQKLVLNFCIEQKSTKEIMLLLGIKSRSYIKNY